MSLLSGRKIEKIVSEVNESEIMNMRQRKKNKKSCSSPQNVFVFYLFFRLTPYLNFYGWRKSVTRYHYNVALNMSTLWIARLTYVLTICLVPGNHLYNYIKTAYLLDSALTIIWGIMQISLCSIFREYHFPWHRIYISANLFSFTQSMWNEMCFICEI